MVTKAEEEVEVIRVAVAAANKADLAQRSGIALKTIYNFAHGSTPTMENLEKLAKALGLTPPRKFMVQVHRDVSTASQIMKDLPLSKEIKVPDNLEIDEDEAQLILRLRERDALDDIVVALYLVDKAQEHDPTHYHPAIPTLMHAIMTIIDPDMRHQEKPKKLKKAQ